MTKLTGSCHRIQGHELGRQFKALVTHDGVTSTYSSLTATDQLNFVVNDFLGPLNGTGFRPGSPYYDSNPLMYIDQWTTPHFVVHSSLDYRLPVSEGVAMFNMLQQRGVPSRFLKFPDEGYVLGNPANLLVWYEEVFAWVNFYTGLGDA